MKGTVMSEEQHKMDVDMGGGRHASVPVDYPANSKRRLKAARAEEPPKKEKVEKVIEGKVVTRKRSVFQRVGEAMTGEETGEGVLYYVLMDVFVPAAKTMISDIVSQGVDRALFGDARPRSRSDRPSGYISYNRMTGGKPQFNQVTSRARASHDFNELIMASRGEAEDVLDGLRELIAQYKVATVADFYDLAGITSEFTDEDWGWTDLRSAMVRHTRGGYMITLPRTHALD